MAKILVLLGAVMLCAGCASAPAERDSSTSGSTDAAAVATDGAGETTTVAVDDGQRVRCITERVTGRLIPERVCRTEADWRQIREQSQQYTRGLQGPQIDAGEPGQ